MWIKIAETFLDFIRTIFQQKLTATRVSTILKIIAAIVILMIYLEGLVNTTFLTVFEDCPLWNDRVRTFFDTKMIYILLCWALLKFCVIPHIKRFFILHEECNGDFFVPIVLTFEDLIDLLGSLICFLFALNYAIEHKKIGSILQTKWLLIALFYLLFIIVRSIFFQNRILWWKIKKE